MKNSALKTLFILAGILSASLARAQEAFTARNCLEVKLQYALQRPGYSVNSPIDIAYMTQAYRFRSRIGIGLRYYVFEKWYVELNSAYSQEGGGYNKQFTNANYWKNALNLGFCSSHNRTLIVELYTGIDLNTLLGATLKNTETSEQEKVSDYFNRFMVSIPVGLGLKTKIAPNTYVSASTSLSMSSYRLDSKDYIRVSQFLSPVFQVGMSKIIQ